MIYHSLVILKLEYWLKINNRKHLMDITLQVDE